ncbi:hypothetical protein D3C87_1462510 [compost metagenome]
MRALALVAVAAAAEHHVQLVLGIGPKGLQGDPKGLGLVGIVDEDRRAIVLSHQFQPPARAHQFGQRGKGVGLVDAGRHGKRRRDQRIRHLEFARNLEMEADLLAHMTHLDPLAIAFRLDREDFDIGALAPDRQQRCARRKRRKHELLVLGIIDIDDGRATIDQEVGEQPQFGIAVLVHVLVIVEMVTAEIGEGHRLEMHAVEPMLVQAMAGRFERDMVDPLRLERPHRLVQRP